MPLDRLSLSNRTSAAHCWRFVLLGMVGVWMLPGCFVPGGGWTLRTGFDCRTHHKPGLYMEMVDSRWDEYNRLAVLNSMSPPVDYQTPTQPCDDSGQLPPTPAPIGGPEFAPLDSPGPRDFAPPATPTPPVPSPPPPADDPLPPMPPVGPSASRRKDTQVQPASYSRTGAWLFPRP